MSDLTYVEELTDEQFDEFDIEFYDEVEYIDDNGCVGDGNWGRVCDPFESLVELGQEMVEAGIPFVERLLADRERCDLGLLSRDAEFAALALVALQHGYVGD